MYAAEPTASRRFAEPHGGASRWLRVFSSAWAVYILIHTALVYFDWFAFADLRELGLNIVLIAAAVAVLFRPHSVPRLCLLAGLSFVNEWLDMPYTANHLFVTMLVDATILLTAGLVWASGRGGGFLADRFGRALAPVLRAELLVLYFWVVVHKLNRDYLNPEVSCGWRLYEQMASNINGVTGFGLMPINDWMRLPCLAGALVMEALIPILLAVPRVRRLGIALGVMFHTMLALHPNLYIASFTSMMIALYAAFLPVPVAESVSARWPRSARTKIGAARLMLPGVAACLLVAVAVAVLAGLRGDLSRAGLIAALHVVAPLSAKALFFGWAMFVGWLVASTWGSWRSPPALDTARPIDLGRLMWARWALPSLLLLNGLSPYLGLKTHTSLAMFSNLRTEGGISNHLLLPSTTRLAPFLDEEVVVIDSQPVKWEIPPDGLRVTLHDVRNVLGRYHRASDARVVIRDPSGAIQQIVRAEQPDSLFFRSPPYLVGKLFGSKPIPPDNGPCDCRH
jgi:hypothetical protein